jgi:hypothetical protein
MPLVLRDCVKQGTSSVGVGDMVLDVDLPYFVPFRTAYGANPWSDLFIYEAHAVDANGARAGAWETGIGKYVQDGAAHLLRRLYALVGSNGEAAGFVDFPAGPKHVSVTVSGAQGNTIKIDQAPLGVELSLYVRSDAVGGGSGFEDTPEQAFGSLVDALDLASALFSKVSIYVGAGTFYGHDIAYSPPGCEISIFGAGATATLLGKLSAPEGVKLSVYGCSVTGVAADGAGAKIDMTSARFSPSTNEAHVVSRNGGVVNLGGYAVVGGCTGPHLLAENFGQINVNNWMTLGANVDMAGGWCSGGNGFGLIRFGPSANFDLGAFAVTGKRFDLVLNSVCDTGGRGNIFLPGDVAGTTSFGGQYR